MKSFNDYIELHEVGNQPYKWTKLTTSAYGRHWKATFVTTDNNKEKYIFEALRVSIGWEVIFHSADAEDYDDYMGVTGTQGTSAVRVFSTVAQIFEAFVKEITPIKVTFTADKTEGTLRGSRSKIYSRFAKRFAKKHGYDLKEKDAGNETVFIFSSSSSSSTKKGKKNK